MKKTTFTVYRCSDCNQISSDMDLSEDSYYPDLDDLQLRPQIPAEIMNEVLICKCGKRNNWFTLLEVSEIVSTSAQAIAFMEQQ